MRQVKQGRQRALAVLAACLAAWSCIASPSGSFGQDRHNTTAVGRSVPVAVEFSSLDNATIYSISREDCVIKWTVYHAEINQGVIKHWAHCPATLTRQRPYLAAILEEFFSREGSEPPLHTLFWGGLWPERKPAALEMSLRLALAAHRSRGWDAARGKPVNGDMNGCVRELANREPIYPELIELFAPFQKRIRISSVEKVRVLPAEQLPFYDQLQKEGVQAAERLPFDCMTWFTVTSGSRETEHQETPGTAVPK